MISCSVSPAAAICRPGSETVVGPHRAAVLNKTFTAVLEKSRREESVFPSASYQPWDAEGPDGPSKQTSLYQAQFAKYSSSVG